MEIILSITYVALFIFILYRLSFFRNCGINQYRLYFFFILKIASGLLLAWLYKIRYEGGDIYSYFYDAKIIYQAIHKNILHYLQMVSGINADNPELSEYYSQMDSWKNKYSSSLFNNNTLIIRINAILLLFSLGFFSVHTIAMSFISLAGLVALYKTLSTNADDFQKQLLQLFIFLTPSVLVWCSALLKESLAIAGLGFFLHGLNKLSRSAFSINYLLLTISAFLVLFFDRFYFAFAITIPALAFYITGKSPSLKPMLVYTTCLITCIPIGWFVISQITNQTPSTILMEQQQKSIRFASGGTYLVGNNKVIIWPFEKKQELIVTEKPRHYKIKENAEYNYLRIGKFETLLSEKKPDSDTNSYRMEANLTPAKNLIKIPIINNNITSLITAAPLAIATAIIQPCFLYTNDIFVLSSSIENIALLIFLFFSFLFLKKTTNNNLILFCIVFITLSYTILGLTVPVAGTLVRYKAPLIPFLVAIGILLIDKEKIIRKFRFMYKSRS